MANARVETMAWTDEAPWKGLGNKVTNNMAPDAMLKAAGLNWTVSKSPMFFKPNGEYVPTPERFVLMRDTDFQPLSYVGKTYKPVQNADWLEFVKKYVTAGHMRLETMGSMYRGKYVWCLARVTEGFEIGKDKILPHLLICQPHVLGRAMVMQFTAVREACNNSIQITLGKALRGKFSSGYGFRMPHSIEFNDNVKKQAEIALGLAKEHVAEFKEVVTLLSKKKATKEKTEDFFCEVLKFDPKDAVKKKDGDVREPLMLPQFRAALTHAPGHQLTSAAGTWWGALNAVTYVVDHTHGKDASISLKSAWLGQRSRLKRRALDLAIKAAS